MNTVKAVFTNLYNDKRAIGVLNTAHSFLCQCMRKDRQFIPVYNLRVMREHS